MEEEPTGFKIARPKFNNTKAETMMPIIATNTKDSIFLPKKYKMTDKNNSTDTTNRIIDIGLICILIIEGKKILLIILLSWSL